MKLIWKLFAILATVTMLAGLLFVHVSAGTTKSGTWEQLSWELNEAGVLTISGEGAMKDFEGDVQSAWGPYRSDVKSIVIENGVTSIGSHAFNGCDKLTSFVIPESVTDIRGGAFARCTGLTEFLIPSSVTSLGTAAFGGCTGLTSITIPSGVTNIGSQLFWRCSGLESVTVDSNNTVYHSAQNCIIETESKTLIAGCKNSVIPADGSVISISMEAFAGCLNLTHIEIPNGVTSIGDYVFWNSTDLTSVTIPNSVTDIGGWTFHSCTALEKIVFRGTEEQWALVNKGENSIPDGCQIYYEPMISNPSTDKDEETGVDAGCSSLVVCCAMPLVCLCGGVALLKRSRSE